MSDEKFDPFLLCGPGDRKKKTREPKADPKEKELIKELAEAIKWQQLIIRALLKGTPARNTDECIAFADHAVKKAIETLNSNFA